MNRLAILGTLLASLPGTALAQSCVEFTAPSSELQLRYDPFASGRIDRTFNVRLRRLDDRVTSVRFLFADPDPHNAQPVVGIGGPRTYEIEWARDASRDVLAIGGEQPNATNGALVGFGSAPGGSVRNESFRVRVPAGQDVGAGNYYQPLEVRFQCYSGDDELEPPQVQSDGRVALDLRVEERIKAFVGSPGVRRGTLDFGTLTPGLGKVSRSLSLTAQSTVPYEIDIDADNGALARGGREEPAIPYSMWLSDLPVRDGSRLGCPRTNAPSGKTHLLRAQLDSADAGKVAAGSYSDIVTLTFSPRIGLGGNSGCSVISY
jgi:hypothetical protein